jgi:hypothetical protein
MVLNEGETKTDETEACLLKLLLRGHNFHRAHFLDELEPGVTVSKLCAIKAYAMTHTSFLCP